MVINGGEKRLNNIMEIWELLDKDGNQTGKTIKRGEPIPEGLYHLGADIWIINSENKILIQKRSSQKRQFPNMWAMTGGAVIKGESSMQAIEREVYEELGVKLDTQEIQFIQRYKTGKVWLDVYLVKKDIDLNNVIMQEEEVSQVKWATYDEIEDIFYKGQFMQNRWEFVRQKIKFIIKK